MPKKIFISMLLTLTPGLFCQSLFEEKAFIFNVSNIVSELSPYQGGIGLKTGNGNTYLRFNADLYYSQKNNFKKFALGTTLEKHINNEKVSPYWGVTASSAFSFFENTFQGESISNISKLGFVLGTEIRLTDYLSISGEYELSAQFDYLKETTEVGGIPNTNEDYNILIESALGNNGMIAIIIYL